MSELDHSAAAASEIPRFARTADADSSLVSERREREGLPASYRMRADAHYVDQLVGRENVPVVRLIPTRQIEAADLTPIDGAPALARSIAQHGILQPLLVRRNGPRFQLIAGRKRLASALSTGMTEVPCIVHDVDAAAVAALTEADNLRGVAEPSPVGAASCAGMHDALDLLRYDVSDMAPIIDLLRRTDVVQHRTFADVLYVQAWRAAWLATATAIATPPYRPGRATEVGAIAERLRAGFELEARLSRMRVAIAVAADAARLACDEHLETIAAAAVFVTAAWQKRSDPAQIEVRFDAHGNAIKLEVVQRIVMPPPDAVRLFRGADEPSSGDPRTVIAAIAVRAFIAHHGGSIEVTPITKAGSVIQIIASGPMSA